MVESHFDEVLDVYRPLPNLSSFSEILQANEAVFILLPSPSRLLTEQTQVERRLDDAT
jgi:hypothetical protein